MPEIRALTRYALEDVRTQGTRREGPLRPFIKGWIGEPPEYVALVYGAPTSTARD